MSQLIGNGTFAITGTATGDSLWEYAIREGGRTFAIHPPRFEVDGAIAIAAPSSIEMVRDQSLPGGGRETLMRGPVAGRNDLRLSVRFRHDTRHPFVRFRYELESDRPVKLTKKDGRDNIAYVGITDPILRDLTEVRLSEFDETVHSYRCTENTVDPASFGAGVDLMGPIFAAANGRASILLAYEHGSPVPKKFLAARLGPEPSLVLHAVMGNHPANRVVDAGHPFATVWFQFGAIAGDREELRRSYRSFLLSSTIQHTESRKPYVYYNTWNYQERSMHWYKGTAGDIMNEASILEDIEVAHKMGIEVYVVDAGWQDTRGDWRVNRDRFPNGMDQIRRRLDGHGMKLGLWMAPMNAEKGSDAAKNHADLLARIGGVEPHGGGRMCFASPYWEKVADDILRLIDETGAVYFKLDHFGYYGCDTPGHGHGDDDTTAEDRKACYEFLCGENMTRLAGKVTAAHPSVILDYDITENGRSVGLSFLSSGKYFLLNNGPYFGSLDHPRGAPGSGMGSNVFVYPGPARPRVCRHTADYDRWVPLVLLLTHYLPDGPRASLNDNLASLMLGHNGIWGDLRALAGESVSCVNQVLAWYKQVRDDVAASSVVITGIVGGSPEVYEKISVDTGRGLVALFTNNHGTFDYFTKARISGCWKAGEGVTVTVLSDGRAHVRVTFGYGESGTFVLFGAR